MTTKSNKLKGRRYSDKEKAQVLAYVHKVNSERGRGGITSAAKKFKITPLTISNWMRRVESPAPRTSTPDKADFADSLRRLADLHDAISKKEAELADLHREYGSLKKKL